ncbi:translation elongation factor Ts [Melioribacteraceae bacterium 4301-Me]|uniref:translation elongation factor Ts n=1 Tax=Pyranulibacter aquaticus TaxID=3163344 RepID=UPI0035977098
MAISASLVKELRDKTGAGMMDCKKALEESNGDFEKAIEFLRKKGAAVAAKRAEKSTNEGIISTRIFNNGKSAAIVEVNCETDFVANSSDFLEFSNFVLNTIVDKLPATIDELLSLSYQNKKVEEELNSLIGKIGEKIQVSRFAIENTENGQVVDYVHHGSKLGVLIRVDNVPSNSNEELQSLLKDIAMQVAAMKPFYVYREEVPKEVIEKEIEIYKEVSRKEGKPEQVLDKIAQGKLNKYYQENCLYEQAFIKDNTKTVGQLIEEYNKKNSSQVKLIRFKRFHISDENK